MIRIIDLVLFGGTPAEHPICLKLTSGRGRPYNQLISRATFTLVKPVLDKPMLVASNYPEGTSDKKSLAEAAISPHHHTTVGASTPHHANTAQEEKHPLPGANHLIHHHHPTTNQPETTHQNPDTTNHPGKNHHLQTNASRTEDTPHQPGATNHLEDKHPKRGNNSNLGNIHHQEAENNMMKDTETHSAPKGEPPLITTKNNPADTAERDH